MLASGGMDRHLIYVGLTRHRETAALYGGRDEFSDLAALATRLGRAGRSRARWIMRNGAASRRNSLGWRIPAPGWFVTIR